MIILLACTDMQDGIGDYDGNLLFKIPQDMKHFRSTTNGGIVVFGRKTAESLPKKRPLPNRRNILLTRDRKSNSLAGFETMTDINEVLELAKNEDVYICGGGEIYEIFMPYAEKMIITHVHGINLNATVFFPDFPRKDWRVKSMEKHKRTDKQPSFTFTTYVKKK